MNREITEIAYQLSILSGGLQGLGLSMSVHHYDPEDAGITELHAAQLGHLVEACGHHAQRLAAELEAVKK